MSVETVKEYLKKWDKDKDVREFEESSATVELAAQAVGVVPARIAKTLSFLSKDGEHCSLVVAAGDAKVDNSKYKRFFGCKAKMLSPDEVVLFTGHAVGGVCPFANPDGKVNTYLDESLRRFETVFPAAGSASSAVEMTCEELYLCGNAEGWIDVCKGWQEET
ncbi:YbaK/EbsC family protein [Lacrimispora sp. NSJ-141]|uniref:YbaK/EbsC family protein n=1 Tax=Lientehia hominis TaxID=2897778 RepID=A0AAP2RIK5_9FIRM|nr:YbaK/EbsC family protein [Lientehia hominis]MCD2491498.1 YbaK/EbsC family protein [Lientehia hominis]